MNLFINNCRVWIKNGPVVRVCPRWLGKVVRDVTGRLHTPFLSSAVRAGQIKADAESKMRGRSVFRVSSASRDQLIAPSPRTANICHAYILDPLPSHHKFMFLHKGIKGCH